MYNCQCENCDVSSKFKSNIKKHMLYCHDMVYKEQKFCDLCNIHFNSNREYETHRRQYHPTDEELRIRKELRKTTSPLRPLRQENYTLSRAPIYSIKHYIPL